MRPKSNPPRSNLLSDAPEAARWDRRESRAAMDRLVAAADLSVVFQPIVSLEDGSLFAYEALVRCSLPEYGSPPVLLDRAVSWGCAGRLGRMIREIAVPNSAGHALFVNVHPQELHEGWLVRPDDPIFAHDSDIYLEVTESVPLTHFELCLNVLREVRSRGGVHLVVDDLGAGYSNLLRIADLEPGVVKLDRGLVAGIDKKPRQRRLVENVVRLCKDLDASVVAEGIETHEELRVLRETGADYVQGFIIARPGFPLPAPEWPF